MPDFGVYGTLYNRTYYDFPKPTASDPEHGKWVDKPPAVDAGDSGKYHLADRAGCHGSQATFYSHTGQMDFEWSVLDGFTDHNYVHPKSLSPAALTSYEAKSGDGHWQDNSCPKTGHPVHVKHYVQHNPAYLLPTGTQQRQKRTYWCWAACISMLASYFKHSGDSSKLSQCSLANQLMKHHVPGWDYDCCKSKTPDRVCDVPAKLSDIVSFLKAESLMGSQGVTPSYAFLKGRFDSYQPVLLGIKWRPSFSGHLIIAHGYESPSTLVVYDPEYGSIRGSYTSIINNYQKFGSVAAYVSTAYSLPKIAASGTAQVPSPVPMARIREADAVRRLNLLVAHVPPTAEALDAPEQSFQLARAQLREGQLRGDSKPLELIVLEEGTDQELLAYTDQGFVSDLWATVNRARAYAANLEPHHEVAYVPLPHLRVDAVAVFDPKTRIHCALFVVPKPHESELDHKSPHKPASFWKTMKDRLDHIEQLDPDSFR